jgi:hypothetical protein
MKAIDGYFLAKREMVEAIDRRIEIIKTKRDKLSRIGDNVTMYVGLDYQIQTLEEVRSFVRNVMLWNTENDKEESK